MADLSVDKEGIEGLKTRLKGYKEGDIKFNEPYFTRQLEAREGSKQEVIRNLLNPEKLVYSYSELEKFGETKHVLHFNLGDTKTMKLPIIFNPNNKKALYILTYIISFRNWRNFIRGLK